MKSMNKETLIGISSVILVLLAVMLVLPFTEQNQITGAVAIDLSEFCEEAINDLVRLNKIKNEIPEITQNPDFQELLRTAEVQVQVCY